MRKPSIFSREYEVKMKKRRRRVFLLVFVLVIAVVLFTFRSNLNSYITKSKENIAAIFSSKKNDAADNKPNDKTEDINKAEDKLEEQSKQEETVQNTQPDQEETSTEIKFSNGDVVKALYEGEGDNKKYKLIPGLQNGNSADISPSGKTIVASDVKSQDLKLIDINGSETVITKPQYVSKNGEVFKKDNIINKYQGYNWGSSAKFIDDSHIAYLSQLPYFKTDDIDTYVWTIDTSNGNHKAIWNLKGKNISLENLNDNKLEVIVDGKKYLLSPDGNVSNV